MTPLAQVHDALALRFRPGHVHIFGSGENGDYTETSLPLDELGGPLLELFTPTVYWSFNGMQYMPSHPGRFILCLTGEWAFYPAEDGLDHYQLDLYDSWQECSGPEDPCVRLRSSFDTPTEEVVDEILEVLRSEEVYQLMAYGQEGSSWDRTDGDICFGDDEKGED